jgi:hypothetical protein
MEPTALSLNQRQYVEAVIAALPHLAEAVAAIPLDSRVKAFEAAERSYLRTFRQLKPVVEKVGRRLGCRRERISSCDKVGNGVVSVPALQRRMIRG